jgi:hypothetical protein
MVLLLPRYQGIPSYALSAHPLVRAKMNHDVTSPQNPPCDSNRPASGNRFSSRPGQSVSNFCVGSQDANVLLPLRPRGRGQAVHEDVRVAAIRESLVGDLLPQKEHRCETGGGTGFELALAQDERHRRSSPVRSHADSFPGHPFVFGVFLP